MKKIIIAFILCIAALDAHSASAAVTAPLVSKQGYGLGADLKQGSDSPSDTWNKVHFDFVFMYEGDTSDLKGFRLYEKKPGDANASVAVEFNNLLSVTSSHSAVSGTWSISRLNTTWIIKKRNAALLTTEPVSLYEPISAYPPGTYAYYVTAIDSNNSESAPSQTFNLYVLGPIRVSSPTSGILAPLQPNLQWSADLGWPENQVLYLIFIHDGQKTVWSKTMINKTGEFAYDGPSLDPAKKYTLHIQGRWTSDTFKPRQTYFAGTSPDMDFHVSANPPPPPTPTPSPAPSLAPSPTPSPSPSATICAQDVKECPDGSYVARVAPSCEFKACPPAPKPVTASPAPKKTPTATPNMEKPESTPTPAASPAPTESKQTPSANQEVPMGFFARLWQRIFALFFGK